MKALILNSGTGSRMGDLTTDRGKCLVEIAKDTTVLDLQIQRLLKCGIRDFCITTGAFADRLQSHIAARYPQGRYTFVHNPIFDSSNYIYSIHLAQAHLQEDMLLLHGDLIFETSVLKDLLDAKSSAMIIDTTKPLPDKDFKAVVDGQRIMQVGINFFENAFYAQPMYKLLKQDWLVWMDEINRFCGDGNINVYAEDALNKVSRHMHLQPLDIAGRLCFEVDNKDDLAYAQGVYDKQTQVLHSGHGSFAHAQDIIATAKKPMIVCSARSRGQITHPEAVHFSDYAPNPRYEDVLAGVDLFEKEGCDFLVSLGGGSSIDVAKGINILQAASETPTLRPFSRCLHMTIPTTAGTGSEATHFAVLYKDGQKLSIAHPDLVPEYVTLDAALLATLPDYHKKSAALDALCQSIESLWARDATPQSRGYAKESIRIIEEHLDAYLQGNPESAHKMLQAAYLSGKAINIGKTTAAHAMSYGLSERFGIAHGHAVALCLPLVWEHLLQRQELPPDLSWEKRAAFVDRLAGLGLVFDFDCGDDAAKELAAGVNLERMGNHPVGIDGGELINMYLAVLGI